MERSGDSVTNASHHPDLADLVRARGPFLSVWASDPSFEQKVGELNPKARGQVIPADVVEALSAELRERIGASGGVIGIANPDRVLLVEDLPQPPRHNLVRLATLPCLSPVIEHRQATIPFVVVLVDRQGADLFWSDHTGSDATTVEAPEDMLIRKFKDSDSGAGYRQHGFQQKAENNWEHMAAEVAEVLVERANRVRPRVIPVAGDIRMLQMLRDHLPADIAAMLREVPGGRSEDGAGPLRDDAVRRWIRTAVAEDTVEALRVFERERGQRDRAADGPEATLAALNEARVDVLLVHDDPADEREAWFVEDQPAVTALAREVLERAGYQTLQRARLVDIAIRSALTTSAGLRVVPAAGPLHDGLGAILRW